MKAWDDLTERGKFRRLRPLAVAALQRYDIVPQRLRFVGGFTNALYRVDTSDRAYALRVDYMQDHRDTDVDIEVAWLDALAADTDLDVCRIVHAADGAPWVMAAAPGVPGERRVTMFEWIPGKPIADALSPERYHQLGRLAAGLHRHGAGFVPPHRPMEWNKVFYWPEEFDPVVHHLPEHAHHFTGDRRQVLEQTIAAVQPAFDRLDAAAAQVIHGDLHPWNVHAYRKRLIAFDFEDVAWGHPAQDVAITLFYERSNPMYGELRVAFEEGYRTVALWPVAYEGELEHFMAARTVMFVNFVLNLGGDQTEFYEVAFSRLRQFLATWT